MCSDAVLAHLADMRVLFPRLSHACVSGVGASRHKGEDAKMRGSVAASCGGEGGEKVSQAMRKYTVSLRVEARQVPL